MDKSYFIELLEKYREGKTTDEENRFLHTYYELFRTEPDIAALMTAETKATLKGEMKEAIWQNILAEQKTDKIPIRINKWIIGAAAAAIFIVAFTAALFYLPNSYMKKETVSFHNQFKENRLVSLQDGSSVILGAGSKLSYPSTFDGLAKREVYLEGEAFFDISHNAAKQFIVHTGKLEITVLGTAFNIKSNPVEADITVAVKRGKVKISEKERTLGLITKGQQIIYYKSNGNSIKNEVTTDPQMVWEKRDLRLDDITVQEAARLLEDKYNVSISFKDDGIKAKRFTTVFLSTESLEEILRSICEFNNALYEYNREKGIVTISKINPN